MFIVISTNCNVNCFPIKAFFWFSIPFLPFQIAFRFVHFVSNINEILIKPNYTNIHEKNTDWNYFVPNQIELLFFCFFPFEKEEKKRNEEKVFIFFSARCLAHSIYALCVKIQFIVVIHPLFLARQFIYTFFSCATVSNVFDCREII